MRNYKCLTNQTYSLNEYQIVPIRDEDRYEIMKWRNEQIYHLRQSSPLDKSTQDYYFDNVIAKLFEKENPEQILFSYLEDGKCIGYGGLVHFNWIDKNAEISFIMATELESNFFQKHWMTYIKLIEELAFKDLNLHKIYTYSYDLRPHLYSLLKESNFKEEARLIDHCYFDGSFIDVLIYSKLNYNFDLRNATEEDVQVTFDWASNQTVRKFAINKQTIKYEDHLKWFFKKINSDNCNYFIAELNSIPIGSIRFDIDQRNSALLSFLVDPKFHGKGYGKKILEKGCEKIIKHKKLNNIIGVVDVQNIPSIKTFKALGFNQLSKIDSYITFEKKINFNNY